MKMNNPKCVNCKNEYQGYVGKNSDDQPIIIHCCQNPQLNPLLRGKNYYSGRLTPPNDWFIKIIL